MGSDLYMSRGEPTHPANVDQRNERDRLLARVATLEAEVERLQAVIAMRDDEDAAVYRDLEAD